MTSRSHSDAEQLRAFSAQNGAGKTTTLRMLLDLVEPSAGNALVFGHHYRDLKRPATRIGAVLEAADFHPGRSGHHHLFALALGRDGVEGNWFLARERAARRRVERLLKMVELTAASRRRVGGYSLGMRQRLGLAAVLLGDTDLLIWTSRPTVSTRGGALATRLPTVMIINKGRLVTFEPLARLTARVTGGVRVRRPGARVLQARLEADGIQSTLLDGDELLVEGATSDIVGELAFAAGDPAA